MINFRNNFKQFCDKVVLLAGVMTIPPRPERDPLALMAWEDEVRRVGGIGINKAAKVMDKVTYTTICNWIGEKDLRGIRLFE